ncbi:MAG: mannitol dehydrogenase family protein [Alphaproteobacteria bacterium]
MSSRLTLATLGKAKSGVRVPAFQPQEHRSGIVHIGVGAFHRAHQAVCTDDALAAAGGDWRITGVSLRSTQIATQLNEQDGLYTLLVRGAAGTSARIIGSVERVIAAAIDRPAVIAALTRPQTRIVTMTVSEKAYGIDRANLKVDANHPAIAHDLAEPQAPTGIIGLLVEALRARRENDVPPFTVLCCDNLPANGKLVRAAVLDFAARTNPDLGRWIADTVAFPSAMVDRITPASTERTRQDASRLTGLSETVPVESELFTQWVIEDRFTNGRPEWEAGGAQFVADVEPFERAKLRMLNGAHSLIAYSGVLSGRELVVDAMNDPSIARLVSRHMASAAMTLEPVDGMDLVAYQRDLVARFANPEIAHKTAQIAMDGSQKIPQRILEPALQALATDQDIRPFAFAVAMWMRYCLGRKDDGSVYDLNDPRGDVLQQAALSAGQDAEKMSAALHGLPDLFPDALQTDARWRSGVHTCLSEILKNGAPAAIAAEAENIT